jgi:hypothetical protein
MKKSFLFSTLFVAVLLSASVVMSSCGGSKTENQEQTTEEQPTEDADMAEAKYACPMHPEETGKKGDVCSKCNMALEEVKDGADTTEMHDH